MNHRVSQLAGTVDENKEEQERKNRNTNAEMKRMIKLGNKRYKQHLKRDRELKALIAKNKAETDARMQGMANQFNGQLNKVRKQMKKNRKHAERMLAKKTQGLYKAISK